MCVKDNVIGLLKEQGMSVKQAADRLNVSEKCFLNKLEKGLGTKDISLINEVFKPKDPVGVFFEK